MRPANRLAAVLALSVALPACIEADVKNELRADGSGAMSVSMKFTDKFVEIVRKLEKINPKQGAVKMGKEGILKRPDEKLIAAWAEKGCKLAEFEALNDEKSISARIKLEYASPAAAACLKDLQSDGDTGSPGGSFTLTRDEKGIYTLAMQDSDGKKESRPAEIEVEEKEAEDEAPKGGETAEHEADPKKAQQEMALMGEMMGEMSKLKFTVSLKVPGEIVDFSPTTAGKKEGDTVTWTMDFGTMMSVRMSGAMQGEEEGGGAGDYRVRFRMPEGTSIPALALTPPKAKTTPPAPDSPEGGMEPGMPEGGK